jgi:eukaryotic-like serine/threonine-protein kinase
MLLPLRSNTETVLMPARAELDETPRLNEDTTRADEPGATVNSPPKSCGDYEIIEEIGRGGMGVVYKARQLKLNRIVALKMILAVPASEAAVRRFQTEAEAGAALDHPGIVPVHDVGQFAGRHFICMGFVDGESLEGRVARGSLCPERAARIGADVAEAIQHAHDRGIIHRDLKPANILIDASGRPRVTDFGLARKLDSAEDVAIPGRIYGTPAYMSPEQAVGRIDLVGPASDIYSLGAILYRLLTGRPPFEGKCVRETIRQVLEDEPRPPRSIDPSIPEALEVICRRSLQKDPNDRFATAAGLALALREACGGHTIRDSTSGQSAGSERATEARNPTLSRKAQSFLLGALLLTVASIPSAVWTPPRSGIEPALISKPTSEMFFRRLRPWIGPKYWWRRRRHRSSQDQRLKEPAIGCTRGSGSAMERIPA